jgi:nucleotide-binding universal stress UspA family protein
MAHVEGGTMKVLEPQIRIAIKNILFTTDFSPCSNAALRYARDIARLYGSKVVVAHVYAPAASHPETGILPDPAQMEAHMKTELAKVAKNFEGVPHRAIVLQGDVCAALTWLATRERVDLIVLGTHGRTGIERLTMGSVAEQILRKATCPVLTVGPRVIRHPLAYRVRGAAQPQPSVESNIHTVLFPTDFSQESIAAAPFAISMAQEHQAKLVLLHSVEDAGHDYANDPARVLTHLVSELKRLVPEDANLWCQPEFLVEFGDPSKRILEVAADIQADLVVMGVRAAKKHPIAITHLGMTTAHKVLVEAGSPVLTVLGSSAEM